MSDLHILADSPDEIKRRIEEYAQRCGIIITNVFNKSHEAGSQFEKWFNNLVDDSIKEGDDPVLLLHEEPLYMVAEYLGVDIRFIENGEIASEYERLARRMKWRRDTP
jgi:hypothetical protein